MSIIIAIVGDSMKKFDIVGFWCVLVLLFLIFGIISSLVELINWLIS